MELSILKNYQKFYSNNKFWEKLKNYAKSLGKEAVYHILIIYYLMIDANTPWNYKILIASALGYLILPLDAIPDTIPVVGFTDDIAAIAAVYKVVKECATPQIEEKALRKLSDWF